MCVGDTRNEPTNYRESNRLNDFQIDDNFRFQSIVTKIRHEIFGLFCLFIFNNMKCDSKKVEDSHDASGSFNIRDKAVWTF